MASITVTQTIKHRVILRVIPGRTSTDVEYDFKAQAGSDWELTSFTDGVDFDKFTYRFLLDERVNKVWLIELPKGLLDYRTQALSKVLLKEYFNRGESVFEEWVALFGGRVMDLEFTPMYFHVKEQPLMDCDRIFFKVRLSTGPVEVRYTTKAHKRFVTAAQGIESNA